MKVLAAAVAAVVVFMAWAFSTPAPSTIAVMAAAVVLMGAAIAVHSRSI